MPSTTFTFPAVSARPGDVRRSRRLGDFTVDESTTSSDLDGAAVVSMELPGAYETRRQPEVAAVSVALSGLLDCEGRLDGTQMNAVRTLSGKIADAAAAA